MHATRGFKKKIITAAVKVQVTAGDGMLRCGAQASSSMGPDSERFKFRGTKCRLAAVEQPRAGLVLEPVHPETAGRVLLNLASRTTTPKPDKRY
jgi:hypothetical protein